MSEKRYILLKIAYDGTDFGGFQVQKNAPSVQSTLQRAIEEVTGESVTLTGCGRTDAGVHAREYFCKTAFVCAIPLGKIPEALNSKLPPSIVVKAAYPVSEEFHPRYDVAAKTYRYTILNARIDDPFLHRTAVLVQTKLDVDAMRSAAEGFLGTHDFVGFMAAGSKVSDTVRTVYACEVNQTGDLIEITISGSGFLYNMVRIIAGTLVEIGQGKRDARSIPALIASKNRKNAGKTMPAKGLALIHVNYGEEYYFD